jgi:hypothetical protein
MAYSGSFLSLHEAEVFRDEFFAEFGQAIEDGYLVLVEDRITEINTKQVVRIMAENAQQEFEFNKDVELVYESD